jgi:hypothetical protein
MLAPPGRAPDLHAATHGQQLYLAIRCLRKKLQSAKVESRPTGCRRGHPAPDGFRPLTWRQLSLFEVEPDAATVRARALSADSDSIRHCSAVARDHAERHGWSNRQANTVINSLRILHVLADTPGARITAGEVQKLCRYGGTIESTIDVLRAADVLDDDRAPRLQQYYNEKAAGLPEPMRAQLDLWLEVMCEGSTRPPRRRPRDPQTVHMQILAIAPMVHAWAAAGHRSLAEITPEQARAAPPSGGSLRPLAEGGLRSLFGVLKGRNLVFTDPTRGMAMTPVSATIPMPLDTAVIRAGLNNPDPAVALVVALVAFHALTLRQLQRLRITDVVDGRLSLSGREIPLAAPVLTRLRAWLDHRARTWPGSINLHLLIGRRSAPRLGPASTQYLWRATDVRPRALREDRILHEIHACGGDVRRICDLFGLSVDAATRYASTLAHPDLEDWSSRVR